MKIEYDSEDLASMDMSRLLELKAELYDAANEVESRITRLMFEDFYDND